MSSDSRETLITPVQDEDARTRIDLGDDLLQAPVAEASSGFREHELPARGQDDFESAKILYDEGFIEQSKKLLRKLLIATPQDQSCRELLDRIQFDELQDLLDEQAVVPRSKKSTEMASNLDFDTRQILIDLDRDYDLGLMPSLFLESEAMGELGGILDADLAACTAELRIDLGIAFLEMGLVDIAIRHFRAGSDKFLPDDINSRISAAGLLSFALLQAGRYLDATAIIQPWLAEAEIEVEKKIDLFYLMGRNLEELKKPDEALFWYLEVQRHEVDYRDVPKRLHALQGKER